MDNLVVEGIKKNQKYPILLNVATELIKAPYPIALWQRLLYMWSFIPLLLSDTIPQDNLIDILTRRQLSPDVKISILQHLIVGTFIEPSLLFLLGGHTYGYIYPDTDEFKQDYHNPSYNELATAHIETKYSRHIEKQVKQYLTTWLNDNTPPPLTTKTGHPITGAILSGAYDILKKEQKVNDMSNNLYLNNYLLPLVLMGHAFTTYARLTGISASHIEQFNKHNSNNLDKFFKEIFYSDTIFYWLKYAGDIFARLSTQYRFLSFSVAPAPLFIKDIVKYTEAPETIPADKVDKVFGNLVYSVLVEPITIEDYTIVALMEVEDPINAGWYLHHPQMISVALQILGWLLRAHYMHNYLSSIGIIDSVMIWLSKKPEFRKWLAPKQQINDVSLIYAQGNYTYLNTDVIYLVEEEPPLSTDEVISYIERKQSVHAISL